MAALLRYFHPPPLSYSGDIFRRACLFPSKVLDGGHASEMALHSEKQKEYVLPIRVQFSSLISQIVPSNDSSYSKKDTLLLLRPERVHYKILRFCYRLTEAITNHQVMISTKAFFAAQALMFILPPNVHAEICEVTDNSYFNMPLLFIIALIGATVGGLLARQRRGELQRLNDQLRQINAALRRQAKIESYAPKLSYAPVGKTPESEVVVDPRKEELIIKLRAGKNYLRNHELEKAHAEFKAALELSEALKDHVEEKKAARGLGASLQRQGKYKEAIKYHSKVLEIASRAGEVSGATEAYGSIADCYTELGDLEKAGKFYDKYIARLEKDSDCL